MSASNDEQLVENLLNSIINILSQKEEDKKQFQESDKLWKMRLDPDSSKGSRFEGIREDLKGALSNLLISDRDEFDALQSIVNDSQRTPSDKFKAELYCV